MKQIKMITALFLVVCFVVPANAREAADRDLSQNAALRYWIAFQSLAEGNQAYYNRENAIFDFDVDIEAHREEIDARLHLHADTLDGLRRAAKLDKCVWGINDEAGPYALLPHLELARGLARVGMLSARVQLHDGDTIGAASDVLAVLKMSRAFDSDCVIISLLVDISIESIAVNWIAANLSSFDDEAIRMLAEGIASLPDRVALGEVIQGERAFFLDWFEQLLVVIVESPTDPEPLESWLNKHQVENIDALFSDLGLEGLSRESIIQDADQWFEWIEEAHTVYDEAARVVDLPYAQYREAIGELVSEIAALETDNPVVALFMPTIGPMCQVYDRGFARCAMLQAMFAIRLDDGESDLADHPAMQDPFGEGVFELVIERDDEGEVIYGLRSALIGHEGEPVELHTDAPMALD